MDKEKKIASEWCNTNKGWQPIFDIGNGAEHLYIQWEELPAKERRKWGNNGFRNAANEFWEESGTKNVKCHMVLLLLMLIFTRCKNFQDYH